MDNAQLKFFILSICILVTLTTKGVHGQCLTYPQNVAVFEGTKDVTMTCNSPTKVSYIFGPTTDRMSIYKITNYDGKVTTALQNLFAVNSTNLIIKIAQGMADVPPISTAGLYIVNNRQNMDKFGAKLVVSLRPTCGCNVLSSTSIQLYCSVLYGDSNYNPIDAMFTWIVNGNVYRNITPERMLIKSYFVSTSTVTVDTSDQAAYECMVTFTKPRDIQLRYIATNAPEFSAFCNTPCVYSKLSTAPINKAVYDGTQNTRLTSSSFFGESSTTPPVNKAVYEGSQKTILTSSTPSREPSTTTINKAVYEDTQKTILTSSTPSRELSTTTINNSVYYGTQKTLLTSNTPSSELATTTINTAVYEGTQNILMIFKSPTKVAWSLQPTTKELELIELTNNDNVVVPEYTNLFGVNETGLIIKTAQGSATIPPISTSGLYLTQVKDSEPNNGFKLIVVRQPPTCECSAINSTHNQINCTLSYGDSSYNPINAEMTWTKLNGSFYRNDTPHRKLLYPYRVSISSIIVNANDSAKYQCTVAFTKPNNIQFDFIATNAPKFSASCTSQCGINSKEGMLKN